MSAAAQEFLRRAAQKASNLDHRRVIRFNMDTYEAAVARGRSRFANYEAARQRCHEIKWEGVNHLDRYLLEFEEKVLARGGHVFWAADAEEARNYVVEVATKNNVRKIVKSKSMVTEEIYLNPALEKLGIEVFETDLGEYIVQLRHEPPYHIVTPAMHLNREQIAKLFREKIPEEMTGETHTELVAAARRRMRRAFFSADMGISGANFLVADTGMVAISTNEGNARLSTTLPRIHVVMAGIEKVIPRMQDLATLWPVLATAGTGQHITTYSTLISGARTADEHDGPQEFHVVLLDNGRSELLANTEERDVLYCIRCGACLNACPVYRQIGGHAYGTVYPGPIGSVLTPNLRGMAEWHHLSDASSLCGACTETCPVKIDLAHHLLHNRHYAASEGDFPWQQRLGLRVFRWMMQSPGRFKLLARLGREMLRALYGLRLERSSFDPLRPWTKYRVAPPLPTTSFRDIWKTELASNSGGKQNAK
ncbi:MAG: LutB/LldF family L-lactate oxidation iron-sulfur protein [Terriglobales bacterium]